MSTYSVNNRAAQGRGAGEGDRCSSESFINVSNKCTQMGVWTLLAGRKPEKLSASGASDGVAAGASASGQEGSQGRGVRGLGHLDPKTNDNRKQQRAVLVSVPYWLSTLL